MMALREFPQLVQSVQRNCHVADARYAREMTLCNYLLGMREFYRWEHEVPLTRALSRQDLGNWISEREALWDDLQTTELEPLCVDGECHDAFAVEAINAALVPRGLVYGGGYGRFGKPHFFLAQLERYEERQGLKLFVSGCEYARDLTAPPASLLDGAVYLRRDALRRWLWDKIEIWGVRKVEGALKSALDFYGFAENAEAALERMAEQESETLILHELGEAKAGEALDPAWQELVASLADRRAETVARAVRDNLADCLSTLPQLVERGAAGSIHFYFSNFEGVRAVLFPSLAKAYEQWRAEGSTESLRAAADAGSSHWKNVAQAMLAMRRSDPASVQAMIAAWIDEPGANSL